MDTTELEQAERDLRAGRVESARRVLASYLQRNPRSAQGWYLLSFTLTKTEQQAECVQRALRLQPTHAPAQRRLQELLAGTPAIADAPAAGPQAESTPSPAIRAATPSSSVAASPAPPKDSVPASEVAAVPAPPREPSGRRPEPQPVPGPRSPGEPRPPRRIRPVILILAALLCGVPAGLAGYGYLQGQLGQRSMMEATQRARTAGAVSSPIGSLELPPTWTPTTTSTITRTPTVTATRTPTASATLVPPNPTVVAEMQEVETEVSEIRGLGIAGEVSSYFISMPAVRPMLESHFLANGGSPSEVQDQARALIALGLINPTYDLYTNTLNGLTDAIGGFYFPWSKEIFVIGSTFGGIERWIYSHEFANALVDQHYHLAELGVYPVCASEEQRCQAIRAMVEGDATWVRNQWRQQYATPEEDTDILNYRPPPLTLPEQFPPPYVFLNREFPSTFGLSFVDYLYARGGWTQVNEAYQELPESTEQILHPEKYLAGESPLPVPAPPLSTALGVGWRQIASDSLGEWMTYLVLGYGAEVNAQLTDATAARAAAGWGGDRYVVFYNEETSATAMAGQWLWDSSGDAGEFVLALSDYQENRFPGARPDRPEGDCWEVNGQASCVFRNANAVLWLMATDADGIELLLARYPDFG